MAFEDEVVLGKVDPDGRLAFVVGVTPTEPGPHPINGVLRVSFIIPQQVGIDESFR